MACLDNSVVGDCLKLYHDLQKSKAMIPDTQCTSYCKTKKFQNNDSQFYPPSHDSSNLCNINSRNNTFKVDETGKFAIDK